VTSAQRRVEAKGDAVADLEADLAQALTEVDDRWEERAGQVDAVEVPLEKGDIEITQLTLVWIPVAGA
jgi:hypothetical protein